MPGHQQTCSHLVLSFFLFLLFGDCVRGQCQKPTKPGFELTEESSEMESYPEGSRVTLQCALGYSRTSGNGKIVCENGEWTVETLQCQKKSCGSPGDILNGKFRIPDGIEFGATVYASCNPGYNLVGPAHRQCYDFGWNNRVPTCEIVKCEDPPNIANGKISSQPTKEFPEYRDIIEYSCDNNYNLVGDAQIVCNELGKYNGTIPSCKELNCPTPVVENGVRVEGGPPPYKLKYFVTYKCKDGYEMQGSSKIVCEAQGWSPEIPKCNRVVEPPKPATTQKPGTTKPVVEPPKPATTQKPGTTKPGQKEATPPPPRPPRPTVPEDKGDNGLKIGLGVAGGILGVLVVGFVLYKVVPLLKKKGSLGYRGKVTKVVPDGGDL
ncbi:hypothetical protein GJAV_G00170630 [Gymnothorax javanicus]|nr:hypothetical protein GJAV_G00170630 [Gymnothorax javanicus]